MRGARLVSFARGPTFSEKSLPPPHIAAVATDDPAPSIALNRAGGTVLAAPFLFLAMPPPPPFVIVEVSPSCAEQEMMAEKARLL